MTVEKFLNFLFKHNAVLIEGITALILVIAAYLAFRSFKETKEEEIPSEKSAGTDMAHIEEMLKSIIEKANQIPSVSGAPAAPSVPLTPEEEAAAIVAAHQGTGQSGDEKQSQALTTEISTLKADLQKKQAEIEAMKSAASSAGASAGSGSMSDEDKSALEAQIAEMKSKLDEYDIISQDIADLAFYKEENQRLQKELANKGTAKPEPAAAAAPKAKPAPKKAEEPPPELPPEPVVETQPEPAEPVLSTDPNHAVENIVEDDIMKDFAAAVAEQKTAPESISRLKSAAEKQKEEKLTLKGSEEAPKAESLVVKGAEEPKPEIIKVEGKQEAQPDAPKVDANNPFSGIDLDKMVSELNTLPPEVSTEAAPEDINVLTQNLDADKLIREASSMNPLKAEDEDLMGQFENFVKKEKT